MSHNNCQHCRELLLSAELHQLRTGEGVEPAVYDHLQTCARCAAVARAILAENAALDIALVRLTEVGNAAPHVAVPAPAVAARQRLRTLSWRWAGVLVPLATAAVLALIIWPPEPHSPRAFVPLPAPVARVPARPEVNATGASGVAVMRTSNPDITVVWTF